MPNDDQEVTVDSENCSEVDDIEPTTHLEIDSDNVPVDVAESSSEDEENDGGDENSSFKFVRECVVEKQESSLRSGNSDKKGRPVFKTAYSLGKRGPVVNESTTREPMDFLKLFWTDECMTQFVTNTNLYAQSTQEKDWIDVDINELWVFFAIVLFLGMNRVPARREIWNPKSLFCSRDVIKWMKLQRFEDILRNLHWENVTEFTSAEQKVKSKQDPFWKVATLADELASRFQSHFNCGQDIDVDEQGIPAKCRHSSIQYNKDKPYKWFFKIYSLNDAATSYMSNFYLFRGKDAERSTDVAASTFPVLKLLEPVQYQGRNHICFVDNYFMSEKLAERLLERGIHSCGTVRTNRVKRLKTYWFTKSGEKKGIRGAIKSWQISKDLWATSWCDKKPVNMLHTFETCWEPCQRNSRDRTTNLYRKQEFNRPTVIKWYNRGMGGTDQFDQRLSYYRPNIKSRRWPHRVYFHFLNCSVVNAFILFKILNSANTRQPIKTQLDFALNLVREMVRMNPVPSLSDVPALSDDVFPTAICQSGTAMSIPADFSRPHYPLYCPENPRTEKRFYRTCRIPGCTRRTSFLCDTCHLPFCMEASSSTNHFIEFHENLRLS